MSQVRRIIQGLQTLQPAQSLLEMVIAIALAAMILTAAFFALPGQLTEISSSKQSIQALALAKEGIEASRLTRDRDWNDLTAGTHGLAFVNGQWTFQGSSDTQETLTRTITISDITPTERAVTSEVTWSTNLRTHRVRLSTIISNWRNISPPLLRGNWQNPQTLSSLDIGSGNEATALVVRSGMVYMTARASSQSKPDFFIIDASNPRVPVIRGNLNTGEGLNAVAVTGSHAYVANEGDDGAAPLQIINISNPGTPNLVRSLSLGSSERSALSVAIAGSYAYIGMESSSSEPEFYIVDITDPTNPLIRGSLEIGANVYRITTHANRVVLATGKDNAELMIINATTPTAPVQSGTYNATGTNDALGLYINPQDNRAYLTRSSGSASNPDIYILNLTNPDTPTLLGTSVVGADINAVFAADNLAFIASSVSNEEFKLFEATDPTALTRYSGLNFPQVGIDLGFEDNVVYAAVRSNDALRIITSQ